ncbi:MAG: hypothetical protein ACI97A_003756 [Planctomycetota bacterium]|jgi:hypothetical protein
MILDIASNNEDQKNRTISGRLILFTFVFSIFGFSPSATAQRIQQMDHARLEAVDMAVRRGWPIRMELAGNRIAELISLDDGRPVYLTTANDNAAISSNAAAVRNNVAYLNVVGTNQIVGVWDGGAVRISHESFGGRVTIGDSATSESNHSTHVAGTIGASGLFDLSAEGMAPNVTIESYDWGNDLGEMTARAATAANQPGMLKISNHSYGFVAGWSTYPASGNPGPHWFGSWGEAEDRAFGQYSISAVVWDELSYDAPYYLIVKAAGNDRNDSAPASGDTFYYYDNGWQSDVYALGTHPPADGVNTSGDIGYDTLTAKSCCKNALVVGSMTDAVSGGSRSVGSANMNGFSGWGPTDDGRMKPDIVGNGNSLRSTGKSSDSHYYNSSGTSMASPNICGSAVLLHDLYERRFPGDSMRSATLKALVLHTADDVENPGPDYKSGWGLMNTEAAANVIEAHSAAPADGHLTEDELNTQSREESYLITSDSGPITVTMVWTDPAGAPQGGLDNASSALMNDLDMRLVDNSLSVFSPWILDPSNPSVNATTGDNVRDNVEQIVVPVGSGDYVLTISHKGSLVNNAQQYSLVVTGGHMLPIAQATSTVVGIGGGGLGGLPPTVESTELVLGGSFTITGALAPASAFGIMAYHIGPATPLPIPDNCVLYIDLGAAIEVTTLTSDALGGWSHGGPLPAFPSYAGITITIQTFFVSSETSFGWALTPGIESVLGF